MVSSCMAEWTVQHLPWGNTSGPDITGVSTVGKTRNCGIEMTADSLNSRGKCNEMETVGYNRTGGPSRGCWAPKKCGFCFCFCSDTPGTHLYHHSGPLITPSCHASAKSLHSALHFRKWGFPWNPIENCATSVAILILSGLPLLFVSRGTNWHFHCPMASRPCVYEAEGNCRKVYVPAVKIRFVRMCNWLHTVQ